MLLGGVAWSELPISTQKQAVPNGNEEDFEGVIKTLLDNVLQINIEQEFDLEMGKVYKSEL
jgi:hypothetical protein